MYILTYMKSVVDVIPCTRDGSIISISLVTLAIPSGIASGRRGRIAPGGSHEGATK